MAGTDTVDIAVAANSSDLRISLSQIPFFTRRVMLLLIPPIHQYSTNRAIKSRSKYKKCMEPLHFCIKKREFDAKWIQKSPASFPAGLDIVILMRD
jgi:hypothetical protein